MSSALIATLGLWPQVITRTLDHLIFDGIASELDQVYIIHTGAMLRHERLKEVAQLKTYIEATYAGVSVSLVPICDPETGDTVNDVETPLYARQTFRTVYNVVREVKQQGRPIHALLAGGRKSMIVYTMLSAQLIFDRRDALWHIFSRPESAHLHVLPKARLAAGIDEVSSHTSELVPIPIVHLSAIAPVVQAFVYQSADPLVAIDLYSAHEQVHDLAELYTFYNNLDRTDRLTLFFAYTTDWSNTRISDMVGISDATLTRRMGKMTSAFCKAFPFEESPPRGMDRLFLLRRLGDVIEMEARSK